MKPYEDRSDLEKCRSQWRKLRGLHSREEWSAAVVRAATAAEIAANYAIRAEFANQSGFSADFVDSMLAWANGLAGKMDRLLVPLTKGTSKASETAKLRTSASEINRTRNAVVHRGEFRNEKEASESIRQTKQFIEHLVRMYEPALRLPREKT
jgi:hypothetical protein